MIAARTKPGGRSAGTSFIECTARSARPSASAFSSSFTNRPLPPAWSSRRSTSSSPRVDIGSSPTARPAWLASRRCLTCCACHRARRLRRVAMTRELPFRNQFLYYRPLPPAHRQALVEAVEHYLPVRLVFAAAGALEAADGGARDQAIAVDAHERVGELALERGQRLLDQVLPRARAQRHVFLLGAQEHDLAHRDERDAVALGHRQVLARRCGGLRQLLAAGRRGLFEGEGKPLGAHRLEQVIERVLLEGFDRVPLV